MTSDQDLLVDIRAQLGKRQAGVAGVTSSVSLRGEPWQISPAPAR
jgi:hypothetical protein